jgi:hypothetical protein
MATLGPNDLKQFGLPSYWDAAELEKFRLADGTTYDGLLADISAALAMANAQLLADPIMASLCSVTTDMALEYRIGVSNGFEVHTEYGRPDAKRGATVGHMLPLIAYDRAFGWTWDFLRKARRAQIDADIASGIDDLANVFEQKVLTRLFKSTYDSVGSSGRSMPWADGGTAESAYVPVAVPDRGGTFLYTHDHIAPLENITQANLETAVENLWEHGYDGPFELLVSATDISSWTNTTNVTGFVPRAHPLIRYGVTQDLSTLDESYIGAVETDYGVCALRASGRIPTAFWAVYKSFGAGDSRNPMKIRVGDYGLGAVLLAGDHVREYPLENAILFTEFGVGVGEDRCAAVVIKNHADTYADPTIT